LTEGFAITFGASLLAALVTVSAILAVRRYEAWAQRNSTYFASFAAGVLIAVSFLHIVPHALATSPSAPIWLLAGYFLLHGMSRFLNAYVCSTPERAGYTLGLLPLLGIGLHSFIDGIVYSITFTVSTYTGALVAIGMVLHEFPEGAVTYTLLVRSGFSQRRSAVLAMLAAAATTPLGTAASYPFVSEFDRALLGSLLAFSAGALIYVGATHLLPHTEREPARFSLVALAGGVLIAVGIVLTHAG
jgi:zinc and cadmium transporter